MRLLSMFTGPSLMAYGVRGVNLTEFVRCVEDVYYGLVRIIPWYHSLQQGPVQSELYYSRKYPYLLSTRSCGPRSSYGSVLYNRFSCVPAERVTPEAVLAKVGVDYAGSFQIKYAHVRKPTILKAYICLFICLAVKAVHLELVSDLTTEAFIASLRRFTARRGCPSLIWSDHGTNFVGAHRELKELNVFLNHQITHGVISEFCSGHNIQWKYIPERSPNFGAVGISREKCQESSKTHSFSSQVNFRRVHDNPHPSRSMS